MNFKYFFTAFLFFLSINSINSMKMKLKDNLGYKQNANSIEVAVKDMPNFVKQTKSNEDYE